MHHKGLLCSLFIVLCILNSANSQQKIIRLYPGAAKGSEKWTWDEKESRTNIFNTAVVYNVSAPTITMYPAEPARVNGTAIIIAPGGAFHILSIDNEGIDVAKWLNKKGITAFVLKYRVVHSLTEDPVKELFGKMSDFKKLDQENDSVVKMAMDDGLAAMQYVRSHAQEFNIDPGKIGFMGFSAGGTVTMSVVYNADDDSRPDFIAPIYAYTGSVIGSKIPRVKTPAFIVAATDDQLGLAPNSVEIYSKWIAAKQPAELHIYARGGHGFGIKPQHIPTDSWIERFGEWLQLQGY